MTIYKKKQWGGWRGRNEIKAFILPKPESSSIDGAFGKRQYAFICFFPSTHPIVFPFNYQLTEAILAVTGGWSTKSHLYSFDDDEVAQSIVL